MASSSRVYQWGTFNSYATLVSGAPTTYDGDVANVIMNGVSTKWYYDATLAVWRIDGQFITTSTVINANTQLSGMLGGDFAKATDTGQTAQWNSVQGSYTYVS